ncbi:uncharacterized protein FIBRA_06829 [Fibroporia radiculosa]|uniref:Uncharacterized protein n=1 Tax=Fibroporia radiculosa TaxID=599839 RepID=J4GTM5_9APHY|nr:uncharacterized protein FIBRA_06829 [Fibroporia radiculosa]CCM04645.1 predicted protein [Fibroporia radiculosa]
MIDIKATESQPDSQPPPYDWQASSNDVPLQALPPTNYSPAEAPTTLKPDFPAQTPPAQPVQSQPQPAPQPQVDPAEREAALGRQYQEQLFARCARGDHEVTTKHGPIGIISAILLFPIGLLCLL